MGGHGALTIALRHPDRYRAVSAFAPIVAPSQVPWGIKALGGYLGDNRTAWRRHDAVALIEDGARVSDLLVDYGDADQFLAEQLRPQLLQGACQKTGISRSTYYRWRKENKKFKRYADKAIRAGTLFVNDMAESQLLSAIGDKNMTAIIFWLKNHHPVYEPRIEVKATGTHTEDEELNRKQKDIVDQIFKQIGITDKNKLEKGQKNGK